MGVVKKLAQLTCDTLDPDLFDSQDDCSNLDLLPLSSTQVQLLWEAVALRREL